MRPLLIVISAPSGAGKSTLCDRLLAKRNDIVYSISCTTRKPRGDEVDGQDYFFLSNEQFLHEIKFGKFIEHAVVHGHKYGTPKKMVYDVMRTGKSVIMDIDVQGAKQIRNFVAKLPNDDLLKSGYVDIFISPPSIGELKKRLKKRGENTWEEIKRRIKNAKNEMKCKSEYQHVIINDDLNRAYGELKEVLKNEAKKKK
jgi:guanylate kinase